MSQARLRIYYGPQDQPGGSVLPPAESISNKVTIPLGEVFPLLADAVDSNRAWLKDFEDDEITIPADLYDVILAYQHYHRPSA